MSSATLRPSELLHYQAAHRVVICKECHYAIQPSAISRHLKVLHHIYRSDRRELMEYVSSLNLADPADVVLPEPHEPPVPFLPTESGLACEVRGCGHLCVSLKRMKRHWATVHSDMVVDSSQWCPVKLQTFFRGNQLRYFIVRPNSTPDSQPREHHHQVNKSASGIEDSSSTLSLNCDSDGDVNDQKLWEHFRNSTSVEIGHNEESRQLWQTIIPGIACSHPFLEHGILACSALHLAYLNPTEKQQYQLLVAYHQDKALPAFRSAIASIDRNNCNAVLAFTNLLIIHCLASQEQQENLLLVRGLNDTGLPDWLFIVRGSCTVFAGVWPYITEGPLREIFWDGKRWESFSPIPENSEYARRLGCLEEISREQMEARNLPKGAFAFKQAFMELSNAFVRAQAARSSSTFTLWTAVHIWPALVSQEYLNLLRDREPTALILLAHYCILLEPLESYWYMKGFGKSLLSRIYNYLDPEWRKWLQWPLEEVGLPE